MMSSPGDKHKDEDPAGFYKEKMTSYLHSSKLPPTSWELRDRHRVYESEAIKKFNRSNSEPASHVESSIAKAYSEVREAHREMRQQTLIDSVLGKKNYVKNIE